MLHISIADAIENRLAQLNRACIPGRNDDVGCHQRIARQVEHAAHRRCHAKAGRLGNFRANAGCRRRRDSVSRTQHHEASRRCAAVERHRRAACGKVNRDGHVCFRGAIHEVALALHLLVKNEDKVVPCVIHGRARRCLDADKLGR